MAAARFPHMDTPIALKTDLDMDSFFDFSQGTSLTSPRPSTSAQQGHGQGQGQASRQPADLYHVAQSPFDETDERQVFAGPSHEYNSFKQQTGLPVGSVASLAHLNQPMPHAFGNGYNSGLDDMSFNAGFASNWSTGLDLDADMSMDYAVAQPMSTTMFYPPTAGRQSTLSSTFVDPSSMGSHEEQTSNVGRLWPGMHQQQAQQAAVARAQIQAQQQRHHLAVPQHAQPQRRMSQPLPQQQQHHAAAVGRSRASSYNSNSDAHTEESITRLLTQMRHGSSASNMGDDDSLDGGLPHIARMRKEEEDMDEDERLLASDEGKKLSSKERRQLRNKVSARAFRSRRKEYIGQLEGEVAMKAQEANDMKTENRALMEENARYRGLIQTLLRHPAFTPFLDDISNDPSFIAPAPRQEQQQQRQQTQSQLHPPPMTDSRSSTPKPSLPQDSKGFPDFDASQLQIPQQQQDQHIGLAMIPESPVDLSMLNITNNFAVPQFNFRQPQVFAVHDVPHVPTALDLAISRTNRARRLKEKADYPCVDLRPRPNEPATQSSTPAMNPSTLFTTSFNEDEFPLYQ